VPRRYRAQGRNDGNRNANDLAALKRLPMLISTPGRRLHRGGSCAASRVRMAGLLDRRRVHLENGRLISDRLDPVNLEVMERARAAGVKDFIGGNCTVSLMPWRCADSCVKGWLNGSAP